MEKIELKGLEQNVYFKELDNGLRVILIPTLNKKNYYISYCVKYGSVNLKFKVKDTDEIYDSPKGIAHFLEHKLFEQESGEDPFEFFSRSGTNSNAGTSYKKTAYYISGINNIEENLNYLINLVNTPYFTLENVEKEKGIIIEEIRMLNDSPDWILNEAIQTATFKNHNIKYNIGGYIDSVKQITKEDLYKCYKTFYQPNNMLLVVSGNFDKDKIMDIIENNHFLRKETTNTKIDEIKKEEPLEVCDKYKEIELPNISVSKIAINFKLSLKDIEDRYTYLLYVASLMSILFGDSSSFKEDIFKKGYATYIDYGTMTIDDFLILEFFAEGTKPKELLKEIINRFEKQKIQEQQLIRHKKVCIASNVKKSDDVEAIADDIISNYLNFDRIISDKLNIIKNMNFSEFERIRKSLNLNNNTTIFLKNKNDH